MHATRRGAHSSAGSLPNLPPLPGLVGVGGSSSLSQLCFDPSSFASRDVEFDADAFVKRALSGANPAFDAQRASADTIDSSRRPSLAPGALPSMPEHAASPSVPLELLREHLTRYQLHVKNELIELLNREYAAFIGLSSSLTGLDARLHAIRAALHALQADISKLSSRVANDTLEPFASKLLGELQAARTKQAYLHALLHVGQEVASCEGQIKAAEEEMEGAGGDETEEHNGAGGAGSAHARLLAHHLSSAETRAAQRASERGSSSGPSRRSLARDTPSALAGYEGLRLDIPRWMLQRSLGLRVTARGEDGEASDDEEEELDEDAGDEEDGNDAFGLYQALLNTPAVVPAPADSASPSLSSSPSTSHSSLRSTLVRLERVSHSLASLTVLARTLAHFQMVRDLTHEDGSSGPLQRLQSKLANGTREAFRKALRILDVEFEQHGSTASAAPFAPSAHVRGLLRACLRCFALQGSSSAADELLRDRLLLPALKRLVHPSSLRAAHMLDENAYWEAQSAPNAPKPLRELYNSLLDLVRGPVRVLSECAQRNYPLFAEENAAHTATVASLPFAFLPVFFAETSAYLTRELHTFLFSPGLAHIFVDHFLATRSFLRALEDEAQLAGGDAAVRLLHDHPSWSAFGKKWNTAVYFQMRFQSIAGAVETALQPLTSTEATAAIIKQLTAQAEPVPAASFSSHPTPPSLATLSSYTSCLHLPFTRQLWTSLLACFDPHVFLPDLASRFLKLALQCVTRVCKAMEEVVQRIEGADGSSAASSASASSIDSTPLLLLLYADLHRLAKQLLPQHLLPFILHALGAEAASDADIQAALTAAQQSAQDDPASSTTDDAQLLRLVACSFAPLFRRADTLMSALLSRLTSQLASRCRAPLQCVARLSSVYRGTRRKQPSRPFKYVRASLEPLASVLRASDSGRAQLPSANGERRDTDVSEWLADDESDGAQLLPLESADGSRMLLPPSARRDLVRSVLERLTGEFASRARECLADVARFDDLSKKLGKKPGAVDGSDSDKARRQLEIDTAHYAALLRASGQARNLPDRELDALLHETKFTA